MHTDKMLLVPYELGAGKNELGVLNKLDDEMTKIASDTSLATDAKLALYNQTLHRYRHGMNELKKPFEIPIQETKPPLATDDDKNVLSLVPKKWRKNAEVLIEHVKKNPSFKWSESGEMIIEGNRVVGSNLTDLINDTCRDSQVRRPAIGSELFIKTLLKHNTPRELIINKKRLDNADANPKTLLASPPTKQNINKSTSWHRLF